MPSERPASLEDAAMVKAIQRQVHGDAHWQAMCRRVHPGATWVRTCQTGERRRQKSMTLEQEKGAIFNV